MLRFAFFMAGVIVTCASHAADASSCSANAVPIQMVDEKKSRPETTLAALDVSSSSRTTFDTFVATITQHVAAQLAKENICLDSADSKKQSLLQFVNWRLASSGNAPLALVPTLDARPTAGCRIASPWIDIAFERKPAPWVKGVIRWNQRQLLADQALLAGARNVPPGVAMPLKPIEYIHFAAGEYAKSEILGKPATQPIEERVPADLLWLFRRSWQSTFAPFSDEAHKSMKKAMEISAKPYTQLVMKLIDRCFESGGQDVRYTNILDVVDSIALEQYKINTPIR